MTSVHNTQLVNLLNDYADGTAPLEDLLAQYRISFNEIDDLIALIDRLGEAMLEVDPAAGFVESLYEELVGSMASDRAWWGRVQAMPRKRKIAAGIGGITLTAGMLFITARSLSYLMSHRPRRDEAIA